jgi:hypothetical protein
VRWTSILAAGLLAAAAAATGQAQEGVANGTFTVNGKAAKLQYAYAMAEPDPFDKAKEAVRVVVSDVKLTPAQLADPFALQELTKGDKAHAVVAIIDASKTVLSTMLYDAAFGMSSVSSAGTNNKFDGVIDRNAIGGKVFTEKADTFSKTTYEFSVSFKAPIQRKAAAPAATIGPATPEQQAVLKAAQAYMKAARAGDIPGLKAAVVADAAADLDGPQGKQIVEMLKVMVPANPTTGPIAITGDAATITFEEKDKDSSSTSTVKLKKVNGVWKVNPKG